MYVDPALIKGISQVASSAQSNGRSKDQRRTDVGNKFTTLKNAVSGPGMKVAAGVGLNPAVLAATGGLSAIVPAALAVGKFITGKVKEKKADAMVPSMESAEERSLASYAARRKRAFQTGTATSSQRNALATAMRTGINNSFKVGGGAKGLNAMTQMFNQAQVGLKDVELAGELQYGQAERDTKTRISQRRLELGLLKYNTQQARAAQMIKEGKSTGGVVLAKSLGIPELNPYGQGNYKDETIVAKNEKV